MYSFLHGPSILLSLFSSSDVASRAVCTGNGPSSRSEWCDYSIDTDYTTTVPDTGVTKEYWLELTDVTVGPDGISRAAMAVNGSIPGPTLYADWGDTVVVHVTNSLSMSKNGSSIHFHGIRQNYTNQNDGVVSLTQCPTAVGDTTTYTWKAVQYGSSWYHSHFALQAWEGVFGGIVINGPATANYDEDLGPLFLNDWHHQTVDELYFSAQTDGPPTLDTGLINGTNVYNDGGQRLNISFTSGTSYRLRLVNAAVDTHFKFIIDNHTMTVIASDLVPITPYTTDVLAIGMGQRYDIVVTANQADIAENFWLRAIPASECSENDNSDNIRAVVYYGDSPETPETSGYEYDDTCSDETDNLSPYISKTVGSADTETLEDASVTTIDSLFRWTLNSTSMEVDWSRPTLIQILNGTRTYETNDAVIELPNANSMFYMVIETELTVPHPIHLHGHDYFVLAQGDGTYSDDVTLKTQNPPRRDTAMLPSQGYLVIGFETDNPGVWLMHCHIGWHTSEGFGLQFVERYDEIEALVDQHTLESGCTAWSEFQEENSIEQDDSGV